MTCKECKWYCDPEWLGVCVNGDSDLCAEMVSSDNTCECFEISKNQTIDTV